MQAKSTTNCTDCMRESCANSSSLTDLLGECHGVQVGAGGPTLPQVQTQLRDLWK